MKQNHLAFLQFKGTAYHGFQVQTNALTVCEVFQNALEAVLGVREPVKGCSRTDAGVHALRYGVSFFADTAIPPASLPLALNAHLPWDVRCLSCQAVPESFHARYSVKAKTYRYYLRPGRIESPFSAETSIRAPLGLDVGAMDRAAAHFVGTHDFTSLCASGSETLRRGGGVRTVMACRVERAGAFITVTVTANGYLYNMVRILAGTLLEVGTGRRPAESIPALLAAKDRRLAGATLPAKGLFLTDVRYPDLG